ncbi:MAG: hypothetical protein E7191_01820 [Erysipelotrichaceae bacterium]|nr:hypothetical protein [Erysipelotrichaceae bacterium]
MRNEERSDELKKLCLDVRNQAIEGKYEECKMEICHAMEKYPHAPQPHNLMGIILEKKRDHINAMKHFQAALSLDPTYRPADYNLYKYGTLLSNCKCAYDESDLPMETPTDLETIYDERGVGRVVYKTNRKG